jgi:RNA polymerase sigma-70 factor, ECF subfamily
MVPSGRQDKFVLLLKPLQERLERFALTLTRNRNDAKDIVGETILIAYENFEKLKSETAFLSYLFTIASRVYADRIRTLKRYNINEMQDSDKLYCNCLSPEASTDIELLYEALDKLPEKQREAVILYEISGFSHKEICEIQDSNLSAVKMRLKRARTRLAKLLGAIQYE